MSLLNPGWIVFLISWMNAFDKQKEVWSSLERISLLDRASFYSFASCALAPDRAELV